MIPFYFLLVFLILEVVFVLFLILFFISDLISGIYGAPYVPISKELVKKILSLGNLSEDDIIYDLGSGDGRVLIEAVISFRVKKGVGFEISPWPYFKSRFLVRRRGLGDKIKVFKENFFKTNLNEATVVFLYLYPKLVQKLVPKLSKELKSGSKIICVSFGIDNPDKFGFKLIKYEKIDKLTTLVYEKI